MKTKKSGFTLIELLVAVSIVVMLSAISMTSYRAAQKKARDGKRKSDLEQIRAALEMYRSDDDEGLYPADIGTLVAGDYLADTPVDPKEYTYYYNPAVGNLTYELCAYLETGGTGDYGANCGTAPANCNYQLTNP
ncbi:MAG: type II secretion system protein [Patescibacteria group bacterium]